MGITTDNFFENIYSVIFSPKSFYERDDLKISVRLAMFTVVFIALIYKLTVGIFEGSMLKMTYILSLFATVFSSMIFWFLTALFFEYIAKIFDKGGKLNKILFYSAFAPVPFIFFAPLNLIKHNGEVLYVIATICQIILYLWIIWLYVLALKAAYNISTARSFMLLFLPFISSFFALYWTVCFCTKMWYIFNI